MREALALAAVLAPGAAGACVLFPHNQVEPLLQTGAACEQHWLYESSREMGLSPAEDLGGGLVLQRLTAGTDCGGEAAMVLQDCRTGEAVAFGGNTGFDYPQQGTLMAEQMAVVRAALAAGRSVEVSRVGEEARARGIESIVPMRTDSLVALQGREVRLGCGCALYYPDQPGAPDR